MKFLKFSLIVALAIVIISCGPSDEDKARAKMNFAKLLLENRDTTNALLQLDSIGLLYPKAIYSVNAAKNTMNELYFDILHRKETELDSLNSKIAKLENAFVKEKTEFDRFTRYVHKRQTFERGWNRSFLQAHLDETGELYISSNYYGKTPLNHVAIRVYDGDLSASTDSVPVGSPDNHQSDFMEFKWEKVTYRKGRERDVTAFIADHSNRKLKAVFLGKSQYYIILEDFDKAAVRDAYFLSVAIKRKQVLVTEIQGLQKKLRIN